MHRIIRTAALISLTIGIIIAIPSCKKLVTTTLKPVVSIVKHNDKSESNSSAIYCGLHDIGGPTCPITFNDPQQNQVGFDNVFDPGTQPLACWAYAACTWRAYFKFEMSKLQGDFVAATLHFKVAELQYYLSDIATNWPTCKVKLYLAKQEDIYGSYTIHGDYITTLELGMAPGNNVVDLGISGYARDWFTSPSINHGLFLVGPNESFDHNNHHCVAKLSEISLIVVTAQ